MKQALRLLYQVRCLQEAQVYVLHFLHGGILSKKSGTLTFNSRFSARIAYHFLYLDLC